MESDENRREVYDKTTTPECSEDRTAVLSSVVSQPRLSLPPCESLVHETTEHGEDGK